MKNLSFLTLPVALAMLAGCPKPAPEPEPIPGPRVLSFTASESHLPEGGTVTLTWETEHAASVNIVDSAQGTIAGSDVLSGSLEVQVSKTTLFVLTATGDRGRTDAAVVQVQAGAGDSEILLVAQPSVVAKGEPVTVGWSVSRVAPVSLTVEGGEALPVEEGATSGTATYYPDADTTFTLSSHSRTATATVRLRPDIVSFKATPAGAIRGQPVTLSWETTSAQAVRVLDAEGREVFASTDEATVASGSWSFDVDPEEDRNKVFNFKLVAEGSSAEAVTQKPLVIYLSGVTRVLAYEVGRYVPAGEDVAVSWRTFEADRVELIADGEVVYETLDARSAEQGSTLLPPLSGRTELTLRATSIRGGFAEQTKTVTPVGKTQVVDVDASPATLSVGGQKVTLSWNIPNARRVQVLHSSDGPVFTGEGDEMENHAISVYPNRTGTYTVVADNFLGDEVRPKASVTVTEALRWTQDVTGPVFTSDVVKLTSPIAGATQIVGFSHDEIDVENVDGFIDISETGTVVSTAPATTTSATVHAPFEFWLYGQRVPGNFRVYTDGLLVFQMDWVTGTAAASNVTLPSLAHPPQMIAPFWVDLIGGNDESTISWDVRGQSPEQVLIVQWTQMRVVKDPDSNVSFQAQIHQDGTIRFAYRDMTLDLNAAEPPISPTIGVQGPQAGVGLSHMGAVPLSDQVLTFFGPRTEVTLSASRHGPYSGFVVLEDGRMRLPFRFDNYVAPGQLAVTEVLPLPADSSTAGQWVEISNTSDVDVDLAGYELSTTGASWTISGADTVIPARGGVKVLGATASADVDLVWPSSFTLPQTTENVLLLDTAGRLVGDLPWVSPVAGQSFVWDSQGYTHANDALTTPPRGMACNNTVPTPGLRDTCFGYRLERREVSYRDISATGIPLGVRGTGNPSSFTPVIQHLWGTPFTAFGQAITTVGVSGNGYVTFNPPASPAMTSTSPFTDAIVAPSAATPNLTAALLGRKINWGQSSASGIYTQRVETNEDAQNPVAHWIIQWHNLSTVNSSYGEDLNFQLKLFDDGVIEYHYGNLQSGRNDLAGLGFGAVAWLENDGDTALPISVQRAGLRPHTAWRFLPETHPGFHTWAPTGLEN